MSSNGCRTKVDRNPYLIDMGAQMDSKLLKAGGEAHASATGTSTEFHASWASKPLSAASLS